MKTLRTLMAGLVFLAWPVLPHTGVSFAEAEHSQGDIQMLRDAAAALKATNPDLSEKLSKYADREASEAKEEGEKNEKY